MEGESSICDNEQYGAKVILRMWSWLLFLTASEVLQKKIDGLKVSLLTTQGRL